MYLKINITNKCTLVTDGVDLLRYNNWPYKEYLNTIKKMDLLYFNVFSNLFLLVMLSGCHLHIKISPQEL